MGFIYPRTITIKRPSTALPAAGASTGYSALLPGDETTIYSGLEARIEIWRTGGRPNEHFVADAAIQPLWRVYIPTTCLQGPPINTILLRDIIIDDNGMRYQVASAEFLAISWRIVVQQLVT